MTIPRRWPRAGSRRGRRIHLVDLDGAKTGRPVNVEAVKRIVETVKVPCQLGGGLRDQATIATWLDAGLDRVVVGTQACATRIGSARWPKIIRAGWSSGWTRSMGGWPPGAGSTSPAFRHSLWPGSSSRFHWPASFTPISRVTVHLKGLTCRRSPPWPPLYGHR